MNKNKKQEKKIQFFWPKFNFKKGVKGFEDTNRITSSKIMVNGLLVTCLILSLASGLVDIVTYSGLSKSTFHLGTWPIAAAILYTAISVGLISMKFWCAMKIGMLVIVKNELKTQCIPWYKNINKALIPWHMAHKALVLISLITAMSMSYNSIGAGLRKIQQNIENMTKDATTLIELNNSVNVGIKDKRESAKSTINGKKDAKDTAQQEVDRYYDRLVKYQDEYFALPEDDVEARDKVITKIVNEIPGASRRNAIYFTKADLQKSIQNVATTNENVDDSSIYEEAVAYDKTQIEDTLRAIVDKEYRYPNGEIIQFTNEDGELVNVTLAISRLQMGISEWQGDTGDVGESSKFFTLVATYIKADTKAGGMGAAEWLLLAFIFFSCVLQEFCIKLSTPAARVERDTLGSVAHCLNFKNKQEREDFLLACYDNDLGFHNITQEQYDALCKECYIILGEDRETHRARIMGSKEEPKRITRKKAEEPKEIIAPEPVKIPEVRVEEPKEVIVPEVKEIPKEEKEYFEQLMEVPFVKTAVEKIAEEEIKKEEATKPIVPEIKEEKNNKIYVKPAENELFEMLGK